VSASTEFKQVVPQSLNIGELRGSS